MSGVSKDYGAGSVRAQLNSREMSSAKWEVVFLFTAINMLDGHGVLVMSFAAAVSPSGPFDYLIFALT